MAIADQSKSRRRRGRAIVPTGTAHARRLRAGLFLLIGSLCLLIGPARRVMAWGRMAHRAATRVAETRLTPAARAAIRELSGARRVAGRRIDLGR